MTELVPDLLVSLPLVIGGAVIFWPAFLLSRPLLLLPWGLGVLLAIRAGRQHRMEGQSRK